MSPSPTPKACAGVAVEGVGLEGGDGDRAGGPYSQPSAVRGCVEGGKGGLESHPTVLLSNCWKHGLRPSI